jgi:3-hydroxybutyryl-CoA dehydrogenase
MAAIMKIRKVGIIGCGQMGSGIAQVCARSGYTVLVSENGRELLKKGLANIATSLDREVRKHNISLQEKNTILARISGTTNNDEFRDCELTIEAVVEKLDLKKDIFLQLDNICSSEAILATNTSSFQVSEITEITKHPDRIVGLHFFNPVPVMKLIEMVKTPATSEITLKTAKQFGESLGKTVVVVHDSPGFIVNRLMTSQILNAILLLESGTATREDIDTAMSLGLNHPIGPLALADLIGLDTLFTIAENIYRKSGDERYAAPAMLKKLIAEGHLGRKTGHGFYHYK